MLRLADPQGAPRAEEPETIDLDALWAVAAEHICRSHNALLDPKARAERLPASQRWALSVLRDPEAPSGSEYDSTHDALTVGRDPLVYRALSEIRRRLRESEIGIWESAEAVVGVVRQFGLRVPEKREETLRQITPDDLGVVCYQVVLPPGCR